MTLSLMAELMDWWTGACERAVIGCGAVFGQCSRSAVECRPIWSCGVVRGPMVTGPVSGSQDTNGATLRTSWDTTAGHHLCCVCRNSRTHIINIYTIIVQTQFRQICETQILFHFQIRTPQAINQDCQMVR